MSPHKNNMFHMKISFSFACTSLCIWMMLKIWYTDSTPVSLDCFTYCQCMMHAFFGNPVYTACHDNCWMIFIYSKFHSFSLYLSPFIPFFILLPLFWFIGNACLPCLCPREEFLSSYWAWFLVISFEMSSKNENQYQFTSCSAQWEKKYN